MTDEIPNFPADVRREMILDRLAGEPFIHVGELSARFGVSEVTARGDLDALAREGRLRRVRGGAVPSEIWEENAYEERQVHQNDAKEAIGRLAAGMIQPGEAIVLDVGTTTRAVATALVRTPELRNVTVFTNGLQVALELERAIERFTIVVTGGTLRKLQHSLVGPMSLDLLRRVRVHTAFIGCTGVDETNGFTNINLEECEVKRLALSVAQRRIFLADGSKIGRTDVAQICPLDDADALVCSSDADPQAVARLRASGLEVLVAEVASVPQLDEGERQSAPTHTKE